MGSEKTGAKSIVVQERDVAILRGLFESRVMTSVHVALIYFEGRQGAAQQRLFKLKAEGFIAERPRRSFEPAVLVLTRKSLSMLLARGILKDYPAFNMPALERRARVSALTLQHELEVLDVKAAMHSAMPKNGRLSIAEFNTWPLLNEFVSFAPANGAEILVRPDGFIRIHEREADGGLSEHTFFIEIDRSTETQDILIAKAGCYLSYYRSGGFAERCGDKRSEFSNYPFRVLMVVKTAERRNNTCERLLQGVQPILMHVWLTTMAEIKAAPFGPIWVRPVDYRTAVTGSAFEKNLSHPCPTYHRQVAREEWVERRVVKQSLIEPATGS